ncbi:unnamed protein product, partial [Mesorhabditis belari]|uniref:Glutamyl-tRNA(Gln) amidotransferase subunit A, mitochondrial n=1 Tax=Mesorhabditis belari TaxID=2138241 RepID=A0AAF3F8L6_9BILA
MERIESAITSAIRHRPLNALITETFDLARHQAKEAIKRGQKPFPLVVKDCYALKGVRATCASKMLKDYVPPYTATSVQRLIDSGGCVIGKGNMDEYSMGTSSALGHFGPVKNGLSNLEKLDDDWVVAGGSSGGPAVSVQMGIADCSIGSDTGGSVRNPAAFTGVFGFKPTYGTISRYGLIPLVNSLDAPSIFAQSAEECWRFFEIAAGRDANDSTSIDPKTSLLSKKLSDLVIGIPKEYHNESLTDEAWQLWNRAANILTRLGAKVRTVSLPLTKYSLICYHVASGGDIASNMARYDSVAYGHRSSNNQSTFELYSSSRTESLNSVVKKRIHFGNYFLMKKHRKEYFERALKVRRLIAEEMWKAFKEVDLLLTPTACGVAPLFSQLHGENFARESDDDFYTQPVNMAGVPAVSIPLGTSPSSNLPLSVQLIGDRLQDRLVLEVAEQLYKAR